MKYSIGTLRSLWSRLAPVRENQDRDEDHSVKIVAGLGNPGSKYANTRHNVGFMVVDELVRMLAAGEPRSRFRSQIWEARLGDQRLVLAKPQTFMNLSGTAVQQIQHWYKAHAADILVVYDDVDLEFGVLRLREDGSSGGHNGLTSVLQSLGSQNVPRLRIGIGRGHAATTAHVLSSFSATEVAELPAVLDRAVRAATVWAQQGAVAAMNDVNQRPRLSVAADAALSRSSDD